MLNIFGMPFRSLGTEQFSLSYSGFRFRYIWFFVLSLCVLFFFCDIRGASLKIKRFVGLFFFVFLIAVVVFVWLNVAKLYNIMSHYIL